MPQEIVVNTHLAKILNQALDDEYKARDTYRKIVDTFGPVRPFINIVEAEQQHIELLLPLYEKYGLPIPPTPFPCWQSRGVPSFGSS
jgi:hypothetical protein